MGDASMAVWVMSANPDSHAQHMYAGRADDSGLQ